MLARSLRAHGGKATLAKQRARHRLGSQLLCRC